MTSRRGIDYDLVNRTGKESMGKNLVQKIFEAHLVSGHLKPHEDIAISIDQTLTQDATGTMAFLQFEALGIPRVKATLGQLCRS